MEGVNDGLEGGGKSVGPQACGEGEGKAVT